jgi:polyisoprenoid-binding protein YceI
MFALPWSLQEVEMRAKRRVIERCRTLGVTIGLVLVGISGWAAEAPAWQIDRGDVRVTVPLKPGGAFAATTTALSGTVRLVEAAPGTKPARLTGDVVMDLTNIDTGIALRNQHLRENYLEVGKGAGFDKAVLTNIRLAVADGDGFEGDTGFTAVLSLHGVAKEVAGKMEVRREGTARRVRAEFPVTLTDFGITPPVYLGVGVGNKLLVKVEAMANPVARPARD